MFNSTAYIVCLPMLMIHWNTKEKFENKNKKNSSSFTQNLGIVQINFILPFGKCVSSTSDVECISIGYNSSLTAEDTAWVQRLIATLKKKSLSFHAIRHSHFNNGSQRG